VSACLRTIQLDALDYDLLKTLETGCSALRASYTNVWQPASKEQLLNLASPVMLQASLSKSSCLRQPPQGIPAPNALAGQASMNPAALEKVNAVNWTWKPTKCQLLPNKSPLGQQKAAHVRRLRRRCTATLERSFLETKSVLIRHDSYTVGGGIGDGRHRLSLAALKWRRKGRARIVSLFGGLFGGKKEQETDTVATKRSFYHEGEPPFPPRLLDGTHMAGRELRCCYRGSVDGFGKPIRRV
jgi:hypothetical protein